MLMPQVKKCIVCDCFYWENDTCKANAIQVGGVGHSRCDTYSRSESHDGPAAKGRVGACLATDCEYNKQMSCSASSIEVGCHGVHADCLTYESR